MRANDDHTSATIFGVFTRTSPSSTISGAFPLRPDFFLRAGVDDDVIDSFSVGSVTVTAAPAATAAVLGTAAADATAASTEAVVAARAPAAGGSSKIVSVSNRRSSVC